jgi:hypothetical protein
LKAPPSYKKDSYNIYYEKIDSFVGNLNPKCFMCGEILHNEVCVVIRANEQIRLDSFCYDRFIVGLSLFNKNYKHMKVFSEMPQ